MSRSTNCTFTCPCGEVFSSPIYDYVNVAKDPQLQYTVLVGLLNVSICPSCGRRTAIVRPLIYSDPLHQMLVYVHPHADVPEDARSLLLEKLRAVYVNIVNGRAADLQTPLISPTGSSPIYSGSRDHQTRVADLQTPLISPTGSSPIYSGSRDHQTNHALEEVKRNGTADQLSARQHQRQDTEMPPLQVVFGLDQLAELINMTLSQDERLGRLALSTHSRNDAERGQLLTIARKLALEMGCQVEVQNGSPSFRGKFGPRRGECGEEWWSGPLWSPADEYTVWLYGSRRRIGAIMRELAPRG